MTALFEYYNTGNDGEDNTSDSGWLAQTFTPSQLHNITSVKIKLYRYGNPGTITVSIRATDENGHPTGEDLCSGTTNGNTLTTDSSGEWREITLGSGYSLSANTKYGIVVRTLSSNPYNFIYWLLDYTDPPYYGGIYEFSTNSGVTWTPVYDEVFMFEEWGEVYTLLKQDANTLLKTSENGLLQ